MENTNALIFVVLIMSFWFYLLPTIIASARKTGHQGMIFFINMIFGWTVLGWIAALLWAVVEKPEIIGSK